MAGSGSVPMVTVVSTDTHCHQVSVSFTRCQIVMSHRREQALMSTKAPTHAPQTCAINSTSHAGASFLYRLHLARKSGTSLFLEF